MAELYGVYRPYRTDTPREQGVQGFFLGRIHGKRGGQKEPKPPKIQRFLPGNFTVGLQVFVKSFTLSGEPESSKRGHGLEGHRCLPAIDQPISCLVPER